MSHYQKIFKISALIAAEALILSAVSCSSLEQNYAKRYIEEEVSPTDQMVLLNKDYPTFSMIISDELLKNMSQYYANSLESIEKYFDLVVNEEIEENVIYIRAHDDIVSASDYEEGLIPAGVYLEEADDSVKTETLDKIMDISAPLLDEATPYSTQAVVESMTDEEKTRGEILDTSAPLLDKGAKYSKKIMEEKIADENAAIGKILSQSKTAAKKAVPYSQKAIEDALAARTASLYRSSSELLSESSVNSLKYKDYYITSGNDEIAIVCGSLDSAGEALDYIRTEYIEGGETQGDLYLITEPKNEVHEGQYLDAKVSGNSLEEYTLVYCTDETYYDSQQPAEYLNDYFLRNLGRKLKVIQTGRSVNLNHKIVVGKAPYSISTEYYSQPQDICSYQIKQEGGDLYILGGSDWALQYAVDYMIDEYFSQDKNVPKNFYKSGSIYGQYLFDKYEGANLRVMTSNIWDKPCNTEAWKELGEDCSNNVRLKEIAKVYMAYEPDVLALQEMNYYFINYLVEKINASGRNYKIADCYVTGTAFRNYTPLVYNAKKVKLLDSDSHVFRYASNSNSKSYTWGYFEEKKSGNRFVVFSTHLWWQKDKNYPKSSYYREKQIAEVCSKADELIEKYDCPCFIMGDFNCVASSKEYSTFATLGYSDCYNTATKYAENCCGKYVCNSTAFSYQVTSGGYNKSIDHITAKNLKKSEVLAYDYVTPTFYGKLSDHAPLYVDVNLQ